MKKKLLGTLGLGLLMVSGTIKAQDYSLDLYVKHSASNSYTVVGDLSDGLVSPVDLDFNKLDMTELWVINMRTRPQGGNTVTYRNVGESNQKAYVKTDGNSWHFMALPTALAFGTNGAWANSPGVYNANSRSGNDPNPFTGPSLWSADFNIYAQNAGPGKNGSHLDMLHGSPHSMGIAWEKGNQYYVNDGEHGHPVMYDFAIDHGPGNSNHDDGRVRRFPEVKLKRNGLIPSHMEIDPERKWLYLNDVGNSRVLRMDITSGTNKGTSVIRAPEVLAENVDMKDVVWEIVATGLTSPCGLDVTKDRLVITDNGSSEIIVYDITKDDGTFPEIGRFVVPEGDIMGVKLDQKGKIWYVAKADRKLVRIDNEQASVVSVAEAKKNIAFQVFPNPANDFISIRGNEQSRLDVLIRDISGRVAMKINKLQPGNNRIDISELNKGIYILELSEEGSLLSQERLIKQ